MAPAPKLCLVFVPWCGRGRFPRCSRAGLGRGRAGEPLASRCQGPRASAAGVTPFCSGVHSVRMTKNLASPKTPLDRTELKTGLGKESFPADGAHVSGPSPLQPQGRDVQGFPHECVPPGGRQKTVPGPLAARCSPREAIRGHLRFHRRRGSTSGGRSFKYPVSKRGCLHGVGPDWPWPNRLLARDGTEAGWRLCPMATTGAR